MTNTGEDLDMRINGTDVAAEPMRDEEVLRTQNADNGWPRELLDRTMIRKGGPDNGAPAADRLRSSGEMKPVEDTADFALGPLVDKIAYSIARGLVVAVKELEDHIGSETRKVGDAVDRRLDTLQATLEDLSRFVGDQHATNNVVQGQLQQLTVRLQETDARQAAESLSLHEADTRQASQLEALRAETTVLSSSLSERIDTTLAAQQDSEARQAADLTALQTETRVFSQAVSERIDGICRDLDIQQEDIAAIKDTLGTFSSRVDALVERLDRQADAFRSMCTAYSQRETELEQVVDGLARLRACPTPMPANRL
jgi:chromosome segregation ATPase